ncbi:hypothetical protein ACJX0J_039331, partial [Zea mays]
KMTRYKHLVIANDLRAEDLHVCINIYIIQSKTIVCLFSVCFVNVGCMLVFGQVIYVAHV